MFGHIRTARENLDLAKDKRRKKTLKTNLRAAARRAVVQIDADAHIDPGPERV